MTNITLPQPVRLLSPMGWTLFIGLLLMVGVLVPVLNLWLPVAHPLHMSDFAVSLIGKIMCFAICALAMDLIWGYTGILSLGHGLFFCTRRLRHGHVPDAPDRHRWQLQI